MLEENQLAYFDPAEVPRAVFAVGMELVTDGHELPKHKHRKAQLILGLRGMVTAEVENGLWMVPPRCAVWIPGGLEHSVRKVGNVELYILFVEPDIVPNLPDACCTLTISTLLRELIVETARLTPLYDRAGPAGRLIHTMLDQLAAAPITHLHLPLPADQRLRRIADALAADPSDRATIGEWARRIGMSERALIRLVPQKLGMSFGRWRQQFQIVFALERLSEGQPVQTVALDLGYEGASAFITMFKKALGQPPARYLASRGAQARPIPALASHDGWQDGPQPREAPVNQIVEPHQQRSLRQPDCA